MTEDIPQICSSVHPSAMIATGSALLRKALLVQGPRLRFRDATVQDAEFILSLRLDPIKSLHISRTGSDIEDQRAWLGRYASDDTQAYFIVEDSDRIPMGTVRLYDVVGSSFSWGSWILSDAAPRSSAVESTLMVYAYGLACGFDSAHFEVRRANSRVWEYHERLGAQRVSGDADNFYYSIELPAIQQLFVTYRSRWGEGIRIEWSTMKTEM